MMCHLIKVLIWLTWQHKNQLNNLQVQNPISREHYINPKYKNPIDREHYINPKYKKHVFFS